MSISCVEPQPLKRIVALPDTVGTGVSGTGWTTDAEPLVLAAAEPELVLVVAAALPLVLVAELVLMAALLLPLIVEDALLLPLIVEEAAALLLVDAALLLGAAELDAESDVLPADDDEPLLAEPLLPQAASKPAPAIVKRPVRSKARRVTGSWDAMGWFSSRWFLLAGGPLPPAPHRGRPQAGCRQGAQSDATMDASSLAQRPVNPDWATPSMK